jgi:hypothetical protein
MNTLRLSEEALEAINARNKARTVKTMSKADQSQPAGRPKKAPKKKSVTEAVVLRECALVLETHPAVAMWWRQNTGAAKFGDRYVRFSFVGASDYMGVLKGGRFFAVECKAVGGMPTDNQKAFLANVADAGGVSVCVDSSAKLVAFLNSLDSPFK